MVRAIRESLRVETEGAIEIRHPGLEQGARAEVIILLEPVAPANDVERGAPLWQVLDDIGGAVPDEEWRKVPADLSKNLDHYLYGAPKSEE
jgi:hypothetical protein